jgi:hypothetical protein
MAIYPFLREKERRDKRRKGNASLKAITKNGVSKSPVRHLIYVFNRIL